MKSERVNFKNADGQSLSGIIDFPLVGEPKAFVIFAHCFTCSKNLKAVDHISSSITQNGMAVLRFDFTGLGQSKGEFGETNFSSNIDDLARAYQFLEDHYKSPQILIGHSLGGAAVLHVAHELPAVKAVITVGAPSDPSHVKKLFKDGEDEIKKTGSAQVEIGGRPFTIKKQLLEDLEKKAPKEVIGDLKKALLIMHSPQDSIVDINNAARIYDWAKHPKSFVTLDGADHLLSNEEDSRYVGNLIGPWSSRYITPENNEELAPEGEVWTRITEREYLTEITAGRHRMLADEPAGAGGSDLGPSPYGYLLAALGTCTAMTLKMYANHKNIKLNEVKVKLTHDKVHVDDGEQVEKTKGKIDQINRIIYLEGDLSDQERKRLIEIADRCPVHRTIEGKPIIITKETDRL